MASCSASEEPNLPDDTPVNLVVQVSVATPMAQGAVDSRAAGNFPDDYPYGFEAAATVYEGINTLRVIVVDADKKVEGNALATFSDHIPTAGDLYGDILFKVKGGEKKRVYLIANEASITPAIDFTKFTTDTELLPATAEGWMQYNEWGETSREAVPFIDNEHTTERKYIPMSEFFDVDVKSASELGSTTPPGQIREQREHFFVTRNAVKFAFYLTADSRSETFRVKSIKFSNLMQKSYLLPHETTYLPAKLTEPDEYRRVITSFTTPGLSGNFVRPYTFTPPTFGHVREGDPWGYTKSYTPQLYFSETQNNTAGNVFNLEVTVEFPDGETTEYTFDEVQMPNLPSFPRNTFVKVLLNFKDYQLTGSVDLVPYVGVELKPEFGFDEIVPIEKRPTTVTKS